MSSKRICAIFLRQFYLFATGKFRILDIFYWPALDIFLWGVITVYLHRVGGAEFNFVSVILGTLIFWYFFTRVQYGIIVSFLEDVWSRNFINLFSSPLLVSEYVVGLMLSSIFKTSLSLIFMIIVALVLFSYNVFQFGLLLVPFMAVLFIFGTALGIVTTAIVLRYGPSSEFLAWSLPALFLPFSGVFYPVSALPPIVQPFAKILPSSYVFEGMRGAVLYGVFDLNGLMVAFFSSLLALTAAYWLILRSYQVVLRKGLFTRFMTE